MENIQFVPVPDVQENNDDQVAAEEATEEVRVERTDSDFELQLRMWQQFMRVAPSLVNRRTRTSSAAPADNQIESNIFKEQETQDRLLEINESVNGGLQI